MSAIVVESLTQRFPGATTAAVDSVSFNVEAGEFIVLLGPSGCGKTTLLKMINRLYEPTSGRFLVDGIDAQSIPATELRRRIGYVIQQTGLFPHMRIAQNIAVVPQLLGWDRARIDARIDELLDLVGLPHTYRERYPRQLSGGEQQRVGIARALAADPTLMLMDEPFGALDAITRGRLQEELLRIQRTLHKTILFVTHDVEEALRLADRIIVMRAGRILQFDTPLAIVAQPADAYVRELVGADDILRHLSLLNAGAAIAAHPVAQDGTTTPTVRSDEDLRTALARLLASGADTLAVVDAAGVVQGHIGFAELRAALRVEATRQA